MPHSSYYWPLWLAKSLNPKFQEDNRLFNRAQLYLWQALNIYDDLIDGDNPRADLMEANHNFRKFLNIIYSAGLPLNFIKASDRIITAWENSARQEKTGNRLKIKNGLLILANDLPKLNPQDGWLKSGPLALAPIALAIKTGILSDTKKINSAFEFFKFALSAKQMADDAFDWFDDLKSGAINQVNLLLLKEARNRNLELNFKTQPEVIYLLFAEAAGPQSARIIISLCQKAKKEAKKLQISRNSILINKLITPLFSASEKVLNFEKML